MRLPAQTYNGRRARLITVPARAIEDHPGLAEARDSFGFYRAVVDLQVRVSIKADGFWGPKTQRAVDLHYTDAPPARAGLPVTVWMGWGRPTYSQLKELRDAGVREVVFNLNGAGAKGRWAWSPSRSVTVDQIATCKTLGLRVALMPWMWASARFVTTCARELRLLSGEVGGVDRWELDWEGSAEVSWRARHRREGGSADALAQRVLTPIIDVMDPACVLSATMLYWRRAGGVAILRHPRMTHAAIQAYSVWLPGTSRKARSTHHPSFQPEVLQRTAWANYDDFKWSRDIDHLAVGLGWWAQDRPSTSQMSRADAIRRASDACLDLQVDSVSAWAVHLWDSPTSAIERAYWSLALDEVAYLSGAA